MLSQTRTWLHFGCYPSLMLIAVDRGPVRLLPCTHDPTARPLCLDLQVQAEPQRPMPAPAPAPSKQVTARPPPQGPARAFSLFAGMSTQVRWLGRGAAFVIYAAWATSASSPASACRRSHTCGGCRCK